MTASLGTKVCFVLVQSGDATRISVYVLEVPCFNCLDQFPIGKDSHSKASRMNFWVSLNLLLEKVTSVSVKNRPRKAQHWHQ